MTAIGDQDAVVVAERSSVLTEADLNEIEALARENESEAYRGPLLALVAEVRRLREAMLQGAPNEERLTS